MSLVRRGFVLSVAVACFHVLLRCNNYGLLDRLENPGKSTGSGVSTCGENCRIFLTDIGYTGNLGGVTGADTICRNDNANPNGPGTGNWKAMLVGAGRQACVTAYCTTTAENVDWVMRPNTPYRRPSGELIGTTNSGGVFVFDISLGVSDMDVGVWTGIAGDWQSAPANCSNWSDGMNTSYGSFGFANGVNVGMLQYGDNDCSIAQRLYCVEQ